jgi:hypothetical protein
MRMKRMVAAQAAYFSIGRLILRRRVSSSQPRVIFVSSRRLSTISFFSAVS